MPIISAVGHEIDTTLCDHAADVRAETPSGAAELISSHYIAATERLQQAAGGMVEALENAVAGATEKLDHARSRLRLLAPTAVIESNHLRLDDLGNRLGSALRAAVQLQREALGTARTRLAAASPEKRVQQESHRLLGLWKRLESASPQSVLNRGYAIVRDEFGQPVARAKGVKAGQALVSEFHDGKVRVRVE
jgi:exodeoxyribonuclease VII large subunit